MKIMKKGENHEKTVEILNIKWNPEERVKILKGWWKSWKDIENPRKLVKILKRWWKPGENPKKYDKSLEKMV